MADQDISIRMTLDTGDVVPGAQAVEKEIADIGTTAQEAGGAASSALDDVAAAGAEAAAKIQPPAPAVTAWDELRASVEKLGPEFDDLKAAVESAESSLKTLEASEKSPGMIERATAKATIAMEDLKEEVDKARAAGVDLGSKVAPAMDKAADSIQKAETRAGRLRERMEEVKQKVSEGAKGMETYASAAGSVDGILGKMADSAKKSDQFIAGLGFRVLGSVAAFQMGYDAGTKFNKFLEEHGNYLAKAVDWTVRFVSGVQSEAEMLRALDGPVNKAMRAHQELAATAQQAAEAAKKIGVAFQSENDGITGFTNKVAALALAMVTAKNAGQSWDGLVKSNASTIKALVVEAEKLGMSFQQMPAWLQMAASGLTAFQDAQNAATISMGRTAAAAKQLGQEAGAAFQSGQVVEWAKSHAEAVVSVVDSMNKAGTATSQMTSVQQAAFKIAKEAMGAQKLAMDDYARSAITKYAQIEAAQKATVDTARASSQSAIETFNAQMRALNEMSLSEQEYSTRKKAIYQEMANATFEALNKEVAATRESKAAHAELQATLSLSPEKFREVGAAAGVYAQAIESGATPTDAAAKAVEALGKGIAGLNKSVEVVTIAPLTEKMGELGTASGLAITNVNGIVEALGKIPGNTAAALDSVSKLTTAFRDLQSAAAAAAGAGASGEGAPAPAGG